MVPDLRPIFDKLDLERLGSRHFQRNRLGLTPPMKRLFFIFLGMFALGLDAYVVAGLVPMIQHDLGSSIGATGQTVTAFTLSYAIAAPLFATVVAGRRAKIIMITALTVFVLGNIVSALSDSIGLLLVGRIVAGAGAGLFSPLAAAAAAALVPADKRGRALGITLGGMSSGTVIGVPVGLLLADHFGWQSTMWLISTLGVVGGVGIAFGMPAIQASPPPSIRQRAALLANAGVLSVVGVTLLAATASLGLYTYITSVLQDIGRAGDVTPYIWVWGLGGIIGSFSVGHLIDKWGRPDRLMAGILAMLTASLFLLVPLAGVKLLTFVPMLLWGMMGWSSQAPQQHALLAMEPQHGPAVVALNSSCNYLGGAIGSLVAGALVTAGVTGSQLPLFAGAVAVVALLAQLRIVTRSSRRTVAVPA
jgi:predicted MFS family arabinose efflux permease